MIFGDKKQFAIECLKLKSAEGTVLIRSRIIVKNRGVGDFEELAVSGVIVLAIESFLNFAGMRSISHASDEAAFGYLYSSMYGDNWRLGMHENFRDKFSLHDLFESAISDLGDVIFLVTSGDQSRILFGNRDGVYHRSENASEPVVNSTLKELVAWIKNGN